MKAKITYIILLVSCLSNASAFASAQNPSELRKFIVTAYYSPVPNQAFYLRGNYESDIILNGQGIRGASGKGVYPGMLAAPKNYSFGTKIFLSGVGVGTVDDRGGAIVGSGSRGYDGDRIDIWMGYGEDGLKKALTWGKREVYGKTLENGDIGNYPLIDLENFKAGGINLASLKNKTNISLKPSYEADTIPDKIGKNTPESEIRKIQEMLKNLSFYDSEIDGKYSRILIDAIADFQISNDLIKSSFDKEAGYFGPKTKDTLKRSYNFYMAKAQERKKDELEKQKEISMISKKSEQIVSSFGSPKTGEIGVHVRKLQKTLKLLGYFESKDTAIFGLQTKESIINYQLKKGIIKSRDDQSAGKIDSDTKKVLEMDIRNYLSINKEIGV
ncbi:MAG: hypothetical protein PHS92_00440 [Candidatus Gracilibacteria bacterium]|nr:hypothetical protein [Candidatus Gracilibacteria bacterium]